MGGMCGLCRSGRLVHQAHQGACFSVMQPFTRTLLPAPGLRGGRRPAREALVSLFPLAEI